MMNLDIKREQFDRFKELQEKRHWAFPAVFSTNSDGDVWPWVTNGHTSVLDRTNVRGLSQLLDIIADIYTGGRYEGGRFFITWEGAFWKTKELERIFFANWEYMGPPPRSQEELLAQFKASRNFPPRNYR